MTDASAGIQYSDDGHYWWDGNAWQSVDAQHPGPAAGAGAGSGAGSGDAQYSEDGRYRWDGSEWQPVDGQQGHDGQQKNDNVDWSQFPLIEALTKVDNVDDWIRHIGLDPDDLNVQ
jgi:hypothetical protein